MQVLNMLVARVQFYGNGAGNSVEDSRVWMGLQTPAPYDNRLRSRSDVQAMMTANNLCPTIDGLSM